MQVETVKDVLQWTREFHEYLASCMRHCSEGNESTRTKLLLDYLATHESNLARFIEGFTRSGDASVLNTWCYDYLDRHPIVRHEKCNNAFSNLNTDQTIGVILWQHQQVIALYRGLASRIDAPSVRELLDELLEVEEHEAQLMAHSTNRLADL